jgi:hypothetical protein
MRELGLRPQLVAGIVGKSPATLRRWSANERKGRALRERIGRCQRRQIDDETAARLEDIVRDLHGLVGAESLRRLVPEVSRRVAAAIKREAITAMERERKAQCGEVVVTAPGVIRGFDGLQAPTSAGRRWLLAAADACVPYRTTLEWRPRYTGLAVADVLARDFAEHGVPFVVRLDRARMHAIPEVRDLFEGLEVLVLHGPPHHPCFYGQLERQNREHRAWLEACGVLDAEQLPPLAAQMRRALNSLWQRRILDWSTAEEKWVTRPALDVDRSELWLEVHERAQHMNRRGVAADLAQRLAIEQALIKRGLLWTARGARC